MTSFYLQIVTPDGKKYAGMAEKILLRTINGDVCILARHTDYITALGLGECRVTNDKGEVRTAACIGGMLLVTEGMVHVVASAFEWADEIDAARAEKNKAACEKALAANPSEDEAKVLEAKMRRSNLRLNIAAKK